MFDKKAYTIYKFHKQLNQAFQNKRELLESALPVLRNLFKLDRIYFFDWQQERALLSLRMMCKKEYCMDKQEDISVIGESAFLRQLLQEGLTETADLSYPAIYVLLKWQRPSMELKNGEVRTYMQEKVGVLRLERFNKKNVFTPQEKELIKALGQEISHNLRNTEIDQAKNQRLNVSTALNDLSTVFASSLRLDDGLELILQGVQKYFRFDRVRLYLTDAYGRHIKSALCVDVSGQVTRQTGDEIAAPEQGILKEVFDAGVTYRSTRLAIDNARLFERVQELSNYDELTHLPVRRYFNEKFAEEMYRAKRFELTLSLLILDIDFFKQINDNYGHQIGDWALQEVSRIVRTSLRQTDVPCRFGGDEMVIMLPSTNSEESKVIAKRLQERINAITLPTKYTGGEEIHISISQGMASFPTDASSTEELLEKADKALYVVKKNGRGHFAAYREVADQTQDYKKE